MVKHYRNIGFINSFPYENTSTDWIIVVGVNWNAVGTVTANTAIVLIEIEDAQENIISTVVADGSNYIAAPATAGTIFVLALVTKLLIPPGGSLEAPGSSIASCHLIEALDTSAIDDRDSLENAALWSS